METARAAGVQLNLEECRRALHSDARIVAVEAAAGCGKTFEAVALARSLAEGIHERQEVLLLAHTHAAINVFKQRLTRNNRVRVMTLDSFAHELVEPYARGLGLPVPLRPGRDGGLPFKELAPAVCALLRRAPAIRDALAKHYPVILLDEHQDARGPQHEAAVELARAGAQVRFFGDPMQAIFDFGDAAAADWTKLLEDANQVTRLLTPQRWPDAPRLGQWLMAAREELMAGRSLPPVVPEVRFHLVDARAEPPPKSKAAPQNLARHAFGLLRDLEGSIGFLVRSRAHAVGLRRALSRRVPLFEGRSALDTAGSWLDEAVAAKGDGYRLAWLAIDVLERVSAGVDQVMRKQLARCVRPDAIDRRRQTKLLPLLDRLERLYADPNGATWCSMMGALAVNPPSGVSLDDAGALHILGRLGTASDDELHDVLAELGHKVILRRPRGRCISTIHMAKGDEFDHVVVPHFGSRSFPDDPTGRKLLYVAATRARRSLHLLAPAGAPSPLAPSET